MKQKKIKSWFWGIRRVHRFNRKYKDRLFQRVFQNKKDLLALYNAINGTNYKSEDDLEITTLEDVIFMSMKNDKSFIISSTFVNVNIKMLKKWKIKMYIFLCFIPQLVFPRRTAFL